MKTSATKLKTARMSIFDATRPVILNGIEDVATRPEGDGDRTRDIQLGKRNQNVRSCTLKYPVVRSCPLLSPARLVTTGDRSGPEDRHIPATESSKSPRCQPRRRLGCQDVRRIVGSAWARTTAGLGGGTGHSTMNCRIRTRPLVAHSSHIIGRSPQGLSLGRSSSGRPRTPRSTGPEYL